ncbi:hypothetical protein WN943_004788 [Citrus x changshan-huyou]
MIDYDQNKALNGAHDRVSSGRVKMKPRLRLIACSAAIELQKGKKAKEEEKSERGMQLQG